MGKKENKYTTSEKWRENTRRVSGGERCKDGRREIEKKIEFKRRLERDGTMNR